MPVDLCAGIRVTAYAAAQAWYERLFGSPASCVPNDTEAVRELAEHRYACIEERPERAGNARPLVFVDDLDACPAQVAERRLHPTERGTCSNDVRQAAYRDPDDNECGFGGAPAP